MVAGADVAGARPKESELGSQDWALPRLRQETESPDAWVKSHLNLKLQVANQNAGTRKARSELEESLAKVKEACHAQMMLLKELELERIDLQSLVYRLASMRQNWRSQYAEQKLAPGSEIEQRLVEEERTAVLEVQAVDSRIAQVSAQLMRLRGAREALHRRLAEKRLHLHLEGQMLANCERVLERPNSSRAPSSKKWAAGIKNPYGAESLRQPFDGSTLRTTR